MGGGSVGAHRGRQMIIPVVPMLVDIVAQDGLKGPVRPLYETIALWSIGGRKGFVNAKFLADFSGNVSSELLPLVTMQL